jgi:TRAP-type C4-dicarboxylate transport system permease small subunit
MTWAETLINYNFSWLTYIGAAVVYRDKGHIGITFFLDRLPPVGRKVLVALSNVIIILFGVCVCYYSSKMVARFSQIDARDLNIHFLKMCWVFTQVPIASVLYALFGVEQVLGVFFEKPKAQVDGEYDVGDVSARS